MENQIETLLEVIKNDYADFQDRSNSDGRYTEIQKEMRKEFNENLEVKYGNKYIKIIQNNSVWGFIVNVDDDKKFRKGDLLKPASWATPARNKARGNVLDGGYTVRWTGPLYL